MKIPGLRKATPKTRSAVRGEILEKSRLAGRRRRLWITVTHFLSVMAVFVSFTILLNNQEFALTHIEILGLDEEPTRAALVKNATQGILGDRWLGLFRRDRFWFYAPNLLRTELLSKFDWLGSIEVGASFFSTLWVTAVERSPTAIWCELHDETARVLPIWRDSHLACRYLDEMGKMLYSAPTFSAPPLLYFTGRLPGSVGEFNHLRRLAEMLNGLLEDTLLGPRQLTSVNITIDNDYEFNFTPAFKLLVSRDQSDNDFLLPLGNILKLSSLMQDLNAGHEVEYIDLRFKGKVFYR